MNKKTRTRSPAYPYIGLKDAVSKSKEFYEYAKRNEVDMEGLFKHWGFSGVTGSARKTIAALKYFGLVEQPHGSKSAKLTDRALRILLDSDDSTEKKEAIKDAFLAPTLYQYCWNKWGHENLPHDNAIQSHLIFDKGFNESTVKGFISDYKQSMEYASIATFDSIGEDDEHENNVKIGDYIQWESQGILQFPKPYKVISISDDGDYAFVAESSTGILVEEAEVVEYNEPDGDKDKTPPANPLHTGLLKPPPTGANMRQETFTLNAGDLFIQFPSKMTKEDFEDFTDYLDILKRKIGRSVIKESEQVQSAKEIEQD